MQQETWLRNVRLETGIAHDGSLPATHTGLFDIAWVDGKITAIQPHRDGAAVSVEEDMQGLLALPTLADYHIHIDKTYYGGPWIAPKANAKGVLGRIEEELTLLPELLPTVKERAIAMIDLYSKHGATAIRTHTNVDPAIKLGNLERTLEAISENRHRAEFEVVAFPQHGLLRSNSIDMIDQAVQMGATHVGGVDPASIDGDIEKSLRTIFQIATRHGAGIDIHIHDGGHLGLFTMKRLVDLTRANGYAGKVTVSHALGLADISLPELAPLAEAFAELDILITSTVPLERNVIPIPFLRAQGVRVWLGDDSITDHWSPFGKGDPLEKAGVLAERFRQQFFTEEGLRSCLPHVTRGISPLDAKGQQVWPKVGDPAHFLLVEASCSAEAVARRSPRRGLIYKGKTLWHQPKAQA